MISSPIPGNTTRTTLIPDITIVPNNAKTYIGKQSVTNNFLQSNFDWDFQHCYRALKRSKHFIKQTIPPEIPITFGFNTECRLQSSNLPSLAVCNIMINGIFQTVERCQRDHIKNHTLPIFAGKFTIIYTNLNKPIKSKLEELVSNFDHVDAIVVSELDQSAKLIINGADVPIGFRALITCQLTSVHSTVLSLHQINGLIWVFRQMIFNVRL